MLLPVITGISPEALVRDRDRELERLQDAMDLLRQYERIPMSQVFPAQVACQDNAGTGVARDYGSNDGVRHHQFRGST